MINRIFKTILVLTICLGLTIPTNAAVSVSDGSAFVTKAEFAADLNNLSNRMAQLENSLDAKIDSLVSSYLTRNGIWNGAKQEFAQGELETSGKYAGYYKIVGFDTGTGQRSQRPTDEPYASAPWDVFIDWFNNYVKTSSLVVQDANVLLTSGDFYDYEICFRSTKSGLCNLSKVYTSFNSYGKLGHSVFFHCIDNPTHGGSETQPGIGCDDVFYISSNGTDFVEATRVRLASSNNGNINYATPSTEHTVAFQNYDQISLSFLSGMQQLYFFVNKGDSVYFRPEFYWTNATQGGAYHWSGPNADVRVYGTSEYLAYIYYMKAAVY